MKKLCLLNILFIILFGCQNEIELNSKHVEYVESYGWNIKLKQDKKTVKINLYPELLETLKSVDLDLQFYEGSEVDITTYLLEEKQTSGNKIFLSIYESNGEIIGGHIFLEDWFPGIVSLKDKHKLLKKGIVDPIK